MQQRSCETTESCSTRVVQRRTGAASNSCYRDGMQQRNRAAEESNVSGVILQRSHTRRGVEPRSRRDVQQGSRTIAVSYSVMVVQQGTRAAAQPYSSRTVQQQSRATKEFLAAKESSRRKTVQYCAHAGLPLCNSGIAQQGIRAATVLYNSGRQHQR